MLILVDQPNSTYYSIIVGTLWQGTIARGQFMWGTDPVKSKQECLKIYKYFVCNFK